MDQHVPGVDPSRVNTPAELAVCLNGLRRRRGLSYESMEKAASKLPRIQGEQPYERLGKSTVGEIVTGKRLPTRGKFRTFLTVCQVSRADFPQWFAAWERAHTADLDRPAPPSLIVEANNTFPADSPVFIGCDDELNAVVESVTVAGESTWGPVASSDPLDLGVHEVITADNTTGLTPYIIRDHDIRLTEILAKLTEPGAQSVFVIAVGTSCAGKTRALYEAACRVLPDWRLVNPRNPDELCELLAREVPTHTIIWLDELQDYLAFVEVGPRVARSLTRLLTARNEAGRSILVAATTWPNNLILQQHLH